MKDVIKKIKKNELVDICCDLTEEVKTWRRLIGCYECSFSSNELTQCCTCSHRKKEKCGDDEARRRYWKVVSLLEKVGVDTNE